MIVKSNLRAGMTFEECDAQRNYWKAMVQSGRCQAGYYPPYYGGGYQPPSQSGGYVGGVYYPDRSGTC